MPSFLTVRLTEEDAYALLDHLADLGREGPGQIPLSLMRCRGALWDSIHRERRLCAVCGAEIRTANPRAKTCSDACRKALSRHNQSQPAVTP
nr:hypothetical protein 8 [Alphaproteobacteria bacterium]